MPGGNLKVIFHGLFAFVVHEECIEVLIPEVSAAGVAPGHVYKASPITMPAPAAQELQLATGVSYQLQGVNGSASAPRFLEERFPVIRRYRRIDRTAARLHGSIYLPFPNSFIGLRQIHPNACKYFGGTAAEGITAPGIPLVYVLIYTFDDMAGVSLDGSPVQLAIGQETLHIYAEPQTAVGVPAGHARTSFNNLVRLFPGLNLTLLKEGWEYLEAPVNGSDVITPDEARSLIEQAAVLNLRPPIPPPIKPTHPICISLVVDNV